MRLCTRFLASSRFTFSAGPTDVIAFVDVADQAGMMDAIGKIRAVKGVASTDTRIVVPV